MRSMGRLKKRFAALVATTMILATTTGCLPGLRRHEVVTMPKTSMLVVDVDGRYLKVAAFHPTTQRLVVVGWIVTDGLKGKTIHDFDWSEWMSDGIE